MSGTPLGDEARNSCRNVELSSPTSASGLAASTFQVSTRAFRSRKEQKVGSLCRKVFSADLWFKYLALVEQLPLTDPVLLQRSIPEPDRLISSNRIY